MVLTLLHKEHVTDTVWSFQFRSDIPLSFAAGQYLAVNLPHHSPDSEGTKRWFTNAAAPYEGIYQITTRITPTSFKQALAQLTVGSHDLQPVGSPEGDFVWQQSDAPRVFIAAGIGITPFRSMLRQRAYEQQPLDVSVIYGSRTDQLAFRDEFDTWQQAHPEFKVDYEIGHHLETDFLLTVQPKLLASLVYLSGPEEWVESLGKQLRQRGLAADQLKSDYFPNYTDQTY